MRWKRLSAGMRGVAVVSAVLVIIPSAIEAAAPTQARQIQCKTQANASSCYWTRGRLSFYNGTPSFRLWKIGTHRLIGIYSGPSVD